MVQCAAVSVGSRVRLLAVAPYVVFRYVHANWAQITANRVCLASKSSPEKPVPRLQSSQGCCTPASRAGTVHSADSGQCIGAMRHFCLVTVWVANLQQLCALQQQSTRVPALQQQSTRVPSVDHSRRQFAQAAASSLAATALPQVARAANETQPEFDAAAYFGIFSCEGWGQKRMPGSNTCVPK